MMNMLDNFSSKLCVYLSYPITGYFGNRLAVSIDEKVKEIKEEAGKLEIRCLDPLDNHHDPRDKSVLNVQSIVHDDELMMCKSCALIGLYLTPSPGQSMEMFYMKRVLGKPVYLFTPTFVRREKISSWVLYCCGDVTIYSREQVRATLTVIFSELGK